MGEGFIFFRIFGMDVCASLYYIQLRIKIHDTVTAIYP